MDQITRLNSEENYPGDAKPSINNNTSQKKLGYEKRIAISIPATNIGIRKGKITKVTKMTRFSINDGNNGTITVSGRVLNSNKDSSENSNAQIDFLVQAHVTNTCDVIDATTETPDQDPEKKNASQNSLLNSNSSHKQPHTPQ